MKTIHNQDTTQLTTLALLYLESNEADIADETIAELCEWLTTEFQSCIPTPSTAFSSWVSMTMIII